MEEEGCRKTDARKKRAIEASRRGINSEEMPKSVNNGQNRQYFECRRDASSAGTFFLYPYPIPRANPPCCSAYKKSLF